MNRQNAGNPNRVTVEHDCSVKESEVAGGQKWIIMKGEMKRTRGK